MRRMSERTIRRAAVRLIRIQLPVLFLLCTMLIGITVGFLISSDSVTNRLSCGYNSAVIRENYEAPETFAKGESYTKEVSDEPVRCSDDASRLIRELLSGFDREVFAILNLASDGKPINMNVVSIGTLNASLVSPREVFKSSILSNAACFIAYHCHPSGNPKPSLEDFEATQRLREAGAILDIKMADHIIVG